MLLKCQYFEAFVVRAVIFCLYITHSVLINSIDDLDHNYIIQTFPRPWRLEDILNHVHKMIEVRTKGNMLHMPSADISVTDT